MEETKNMSENINLILTENILMIPPESLYNLIIDKILTQLNISSEDGNYTFEHNYDSYYLYESNMKKTFVINKVGDKNTKYLLVIYNFKIYINDIFKKYIIDKEKFGTFIPELMYYGNIKGKLNSNMLNLTPYTIYKFYDNDFSKLTFQQKQKLLISVLNTLDYCQKNNYYIYDLKSMNISYDTNFNCVFTSYINSSINLYINNVNYINNITEYAGTYNPYYIMFSYIMKHNNYIYSNDTMLLNKLDKINAIGLVDIMLKLFFTLYIIDDYDYHTILDVLYYGATIVDSGKQIVFEHVNNRRVCDIFIKPCKKNLDNVQNVYSEQNILLFVNALKSDYNPDYINILKSMLFDNITNIGLLHPDYERIPHYIDIINKINLSESYQTYKLNFDLFHK